MGYSRDIERQNQALQTILDGGTPEKRIYIAKEDLDYKKSIQEKKEKERERINEKFEATKEARMPWFCPKCDKVMKKRLDDKMWFLHDHCFDCQLKVEHKMRMDGTYDEWKEQKEIANKIAWIRDQKIMIKEFKEQENPEFYQQFRPDGYSVDKEKWNIDKDNLIKQADEALEFLQKMEDSLK
jgi:ribosomal protein L37AE/L43A